MISRNLSIADSVSGGGAVNADNPVVGYENRVTTANLSTDSAANGFPARNLANPSTNLCWKGVVASPAVDERITLALDTSDAVDYVAIARHNFGAARIPVSIEVLNTSTSPDQWDEIIGATLLPDDGPALFRFAPQGVASIRIRLRPGTAAPSAAVIYAGKLQRLRSARPPLAVEQSRLDHLEATGDGELLWLERGVVFRHRGDGDLIS